MTLDAHVMGIWCGQIGGGVGVIRTMIFLFLLLPNPPK